MNLISIPFLLFLPLFLVMFRLTPPVQRWVILLLASLVFIRWEHPYVQVILIAFGGLNFLAGKRLAETTHNKNRIFIPVVCINIIALFLLKYIESGSGGYIFRFHEAGFHMETVLLSFGFTFYIMQQLAYLIDLRYNRIPAETRPGRFFLFSIFFPKFTAGPVERMQNLVPQFEAPVITRALMLEGVQRILLGLFKKLVLSARLAPIVSRIFEGHAEQGSLATASGICLFTIQLYFDFSGYTDMAIGSAKLFGINLSENFNRPFSSTSVSEFWRRWHMSLMNWFSQYIYYPLVFRLRDKRKAAVLTGIVITFLISGLWHGLGATFLIWSLLHAIYLCYESLTKQSRLNWSARIPASFYIPLSIVLTFLLVSFSNLFFRAKDMTAVSALFRNLGTAPLAGKGWTEGFASTLAGGGYQEALFNFMITIVLSLAFLLFERRIQVCSGGGVTCFARIFLLLILIFLFGVFKQAEYFIYTQF